MTEELPAKQPAEDRAKRPAIGPRLRDLRLAAGLTQQELAEATGLSISVITQIEQGKTPDPRISTLWALATALHVTMDRLVGEKEGP